MPARQTSTHNPQNSDFSSPGGCFLAASSRAGRCRSGKRGEGSIGRGHRQVHLPLLTQTLVPRRLLYSVGQAGHHVYQQRVPWRVALEPLASVIFAAPSTRENGAGDRRMGPRWHLRSGSH
jgi:hypothetical protein